MKHTAERSVFLLTPEHISRKKLEFNSLSKTHLKDAIYMEM